jgi:putative AlgH/UPF0301 family transcriptional regulator
MWQAVVFLTRHDAQGTVGLILNRPSGVNLGSLNVPFEGPDSMQSVFQENRIYFGGVGQGEVSAAPTPQPSIYRVKPQSGVSGV